MKGINFYILCTDREVEQFRQKFNDCLEELMNTRIANVGQVFLMYFHPKNIKLVRRGGDKNLSFEIGDIQDTQELAVTVLSVSETYQITSVVVGFISSLFEGEHIDFVRPEHRSINDTLKNNPFRAHLTKSQLSKLFKILRAIYPPTPGGMFTSSDGESVFDLRNIHGYIEES